MRSESEETGERGRETYLADGGDDLGVGEDLLLEDPFGAVRDADGADLALLHQGLHLLPCLAERPVAHDVTVAVREGGEVGVVAVRVQMDGPVNEVDYHNACLACATRAEWLNDR